MALFPPLGGLFARLASFRRGGRPHPSCSRLRSRLRLEELEHRSLPSTLTVTTASDAGGHTGTSLRDAISQANTDAKAGKSDTIVFASSLAGATITLAQGQLELSGYAASGPTITIDGSSLSIPIAVNGNAASRVFEVDLGVQAVVIGLHIQGGQAPGIWDGSVGAYYAFGGGIENNGTLTLNGDTITNNVAPHLINSATCYGSGGGIYNTGTMTVNNSTVSINSANWGGGIHNTNQTHSGTATAGLMTFNGDTIANNTTYGALGAGDGGGIWNSGTLTVNSTTVANNTALEGGGIINSSLSASTQATLLVIDSTIFGNSVGPGSGGGIGVTAGIPEIMAVISSTISGNSAIGIISGTGYIGTGGGIYASGVIMLNTILAGNTATGSGPDLAGSLAAGSANNLVGGNPGLAPLGNNGGPTQTMALLPGSPAFFAGGPVATLANAITATTSTIYFPALSGIGTIPGNFVIRIDAEDMLVTNISGGLVTVVRGYNGTTPAPHNANAPVYLAVDQRGKRRANPPAIGAYEASPSTFYIAVGTSNGHVQIRKTTSGALLADFMPFGPAYTDGVNVAEGDILGHGVKDLVVAAADGNPNVKVYDGAAIVNGTFNAASPDSSLLASFFPYALQFNVGATVAVGDVNGDGYGDLITGADVGNPDVRVYSGKDIANHTFNPSGGSLLAQWFAYGLNFNVGANVAAGDIEHNGFVDVVTGATAGNPHVKVYSGKAIANHTFNSSNPDASVVAQVFPFALQYNVGAYVAVGDVNADGFADLIVGSSIGNPQVKTYDGKAIASGAFNADTAEAHKLNDFFAYDLSMNIGVTVSSVDVDGSGNFDILTGPTTGSPVIRIFRGNASGVQPPPVLQVPLSGLPAGIFVGA
jgi:hypothetical protein